MNMQKVVNPRYEWVKTYFHDLKLIHKFTFLIAVLLIGFTVIGLVYKSVLDTESDALERSQQVNALGGLIDKIEISMLNAQGFEKDFQLSKKLEYLEKFDKTLTTAVQDATQLDDLLVASKEKTLLNQLKTVLKSYQTDFYALAENTVALGLSDTVGVLGEMNDASKSLEETLATSGKTTLLAALYNVRNQESLFIAQPNSAFLNAYTDETKAFERKLKRADIKGKIATQINEKLLVFLKNSQNLIEAAQQKNQQTKQVNTTIAEMNPILDALLDIRDQRRSESNTEAALSRQTNTVLFITTLIIAAGVISLIVWLLARGITRSITQPVAHLQSVVDQIAKGDFNVRANLNTEDELGKFGSALDNLLEERVARLQASEQEHELLNESVIGLLQGVAQLSRRDLTVKVPVTEDVTGPVGDAINLLVDETANVLEDVRQVSNHVANSSIAVKTHADKVVKVAAAEADTVDLTVTELSQAASTMDEINQLAQSSSSAADKASRATLEALSKVTSTVDGIDTIRDTIRETEKRTKRLGERTQEINGTVNIINNIAERTHILALNASMHAASAGEAGRGFAVVADEVQRLAESAREATAQITGLVNSIQMETSDTLDTMNKAISQVVDGTELARQAGEQMKETQQSTADLVQLVQNIADNSREQTEITHNLRGRASQIQQSSLQTRKSLEDQSTQTRQLLNFSKQLLSSVEVFKLPNNDSQKAQPEETFKPTDIRAVS